MLGCNLFEVINKLFFLRAISIDFIFIDFITVLIFTEHGYKSKWNLGDPSASTINEDVASHLLFKEKVISYLRSSSFSCFFFYKVSPYDAHLEFF